MNEMTVAELEELCGSEKRFFLDEHTELRYYHDETPEGGHWYDRGMEVALSDSELYSMVIDHFEADWGANLKVYLKQ